MGWSRLSAEGCQPNGKLVGLDMPKVPPILFDPLFKVNPSHMFRVLANHTRITMLQRLAAGGALCVNDFVGITGRKQEAASRHLVLLHETNAVLKVPAPDGDLRKQYYAINPKVVREGAGGRELDFGSCTVRL